MSSIELEQLLVCICFGVQESDLITAEIGSINKPLKVHPLCNELYVSVALCNVHVAYSPYECRM